MHAESNWLESEITLLLGGTTLVLSESPAELEKYAHGTVKCGWIPLCLSDAIRLRESLDAAIARYQKTDGDDKSISFRELNPTTSFHFGDPKHVTFKANDDEIRNAFIIDASGQRLYVTIHPEEIVFLVEPHRKLVPQ